MCGGFDRSNSSSSSPSSSKDEAFPLKVGEGKLEGAVRCVCVGFDRSNSSSSSPSSSKDEAFPDELSASLGWSQSPSAEDRKGILEGGDPPSRLLLNLRLELLELVATEKEVVVMGEKVEGTNEKGGKDAGKMVESEEKGTLVFSTRVKVRGKVRADSMFVCVTG